MSPEQCQSQPLDGRSDVYSLGVVLYEVATGYLPFQISTFEDAFQKHVHTSPSPPRKVRPDLPPALEAIILRCLAKKPDDRYATGKELAADLQKVLDQIPGEVPVPSPSIESINRIGMDVEPQTLTITPGQPTTVAVSLTNLGNTVDWFTTTVEGVVPEWVQGPAEASQLNPGMHETITLRINVARTATNRAQTYSVTIRARSHEKPNESRTVQGTWTVQPFKEATLGLEPRRASGRGSAAYTVTLQNGGNTPDQYELSGENDEKKLAYRFGQNPVELDSGKEARVPLQVSTNRRWIGREQRKPFQVHARPADNRTPLTAPGEFVNKVLIPDWGMILLTLLLVIGGIVYFVCPYKTTHTLSSTLSRTIVVKVTDSATIEAAHTLIKADAKRSLQAKLRWDEHFINEPQCWSESAGWGLAGREIDYKISATCRGEVVNCGWPFGTIVVCPAGIFQFSRQGEEVLFSSTGLLTAFYPHLLEGWWPFAAFDEAVCNSKRR